MPFCGNCGKEVAAGKKFCASCGSPVESAPAQQATDQQTVYTQPPVQAVPPPAGPARGFEKIKNMATNTRDHTGDIDPDDIQKNKTMGGLAYFLFFLPLIACPESKYGRFHANQGLIYLILCMAGGIVNAIFSAILLGISWRLYFLVSIFTGIIWLAVGVLGIIGLINGFSGKAKELPFIGKFRIIK